MEETWIGERNVFRHLSNRKSKLFAILRNRNYYEGRDRIWDKQYFCSLLCFRKVINSLVRLFGTVETSVFVAF